MTILCMDITTYCVIYCAVKSKVFIGDVYINMFTVAPDYNTCVIIATAMVMLHYNIYHDL